MLEKFLEFEKAKKISKIFVSKFYVFCFIVLVLFLNISQIYSLNRDDYLHIYNGHDDLADFVCRDHIAFLKRYDKLIDDPEIISKIHLFPTIDTPCGDHYYYYCPSTECIYPGYLEKYFNRNLTTFKEYLKYVSKHKECQCYWPEKSFLAAKINEKAFCLFKDLVYCTLLSNLYSNGYYFYDNYISEVYEDGFFEKFEPFFPQEQYLNEVSIATSFIARSFLYTDYLNVCQDLYAYSLRNYTKDDCLEIKRHLDGILECINPLFIELYDLCLSQHPNEEIEAQRFIALVDAGRGDEVAMPKKSFCIDSFLVKNSYNNERNIKKVCNLVTCSNPTEQHVPYKNTVCTTCFSIDSLLHFNRGVFLNESLCYNDAISALTLAININPSNRDAYIERAMAYFETNQIDLALEDYKEANKLSIKPPFISYEKHALIGLNNYSASTIIIYVPTNNTEFFGALLLGASEGAKVSVVDFFPSILHTLNGLGYGLWSFAHSPIATSNELIDASCACVDFIRTSSNQEILEIIVPELKELIVKWDFLNDKEKGRRIGYIIGKYGVDVFGGVAAVKSIKYCRELRRANTMATLQACASSVDNKKIILAKAVERRVIREQGFKNGNLKIHWGRQNKHVPGQHNYEPGRSVFEHKDPQGLINQFAGKGKRMNEEIPGTPNYKEVIDFGEHIGVYKSKDGTISLPSTKGTIHYSKEGVHIVPTHPNS